MLPYIPVCSSSSASAASFSLSFSVRECFEQETKVALLPRFLFCLVQVPTPCAGIRELCVVVQCRQTIAQHPIPNEEFGAKWLERHVTCGLEICRKTSERIAYESILNGKPPCLHPPPSLPPLFTLSARATHPVPLLISIYSNPQVKCGLWLLEHRLELNSNCNASNLYSHCV